VNWAIEEKDYSRARACALIGLAPKTYRYQSKCGGDEAVRERLRELAGERRRFGYRRLHLLPRREGMTLNRKKLYRLYKEERLAVRKRGDRKRALGTRAPMAVPQGINQRWSLDFVGHADRRQALWFAESFIGRFRDECLNEHLFGSLKQARRIIEAWRLNYNRALEHPSATSLK
jgi:putative transposase